MFKFLNVTIILPTYGVRFVCFKLRIISYKIEFMMYESYVWEREVIRIIIMQSSEYVSRRIDQALAVVHSGIICAYEFEIRMRGQELDKYHGEPLCTM